VLSGRGLCDKLITRPEESYRLWCVVVCDLETSWRRRLRPTGGGGAVAPKRNKNSSNGNKIFTVKKKIFGIMVAVKRVKSSRRLLKRSEVFPCLY